MTGEFQIVHGEVETVLSTLPDNIFDGVFCDPPYGLSFMGKKWDYQVPTASLWAQVLRVCKPGAALLAFGGTRTYHRMVVQIEDAGWEIRDQLAWMYGSGFPKSLSLPGGYGTALKPAYEPICLARKPLEGTVEGNLARWGCGILDIERCRIGTEVLPEATAGQARVGTFERGVMVTPERVGRWPANVLMDEEAGQILDAQSGNRPGMSGGGKHKAGYEGSMFGGPDCGLVRPADNGGASRFFYSAKASRKERDLGCEDLPPRTGGETTDRTDGSKGLDSPRAGAGRKGGARNHHPTVKPLSLTEYLARLIMPGPGRNLLVPFSGSGSEVAGGLRAGWGSVLGIEMEADYIPIATRRIPALVGLPHAG